MATSVMVVRPLLAEGRRWVEVLRPGEDSRNLRVGVVRLQPGERVGEHSTGEREEVICVLRGSGLLVAEDGGHPFEAGSLVYVPPGMRHDVENRGDVVLEYIYLTASAP